MGKKKEDELPNPMGFTDEDLEEIEEELEASDDAGETHEEPEGEATPEPEQPAAEGEIEEVAAQEPEEVDEIDETTPQEGDDDHTRGIRAALARERAEKQALRDKMKHLEQMSAYRQPPQAGPNQFAQMPGTPPQQAQTAPQAAPTTNGQGIPIHFDENGEAAYIPTDQIRAALAPTPEEQRRNQTVQQYQGMVQQFIGFDEASHEKQSTVQRATQVYNYTMQQAAQAAQLRGYDFAAMTRDTDTLLDFLDQSGVLAGVSEQAPDVAPYLEDLIDANQRESLRGMQRFFTNYHGARTAPQTPGQSAPAPKPGAGASVKPRVPVPDDKPPSMAKRGTKEENTTTHRAEFETLLEEVNDAPWNVSAEKYKRFEELSAMYEAGSI